MTEKMLILPSCRSTLGSGDERCFCANQSELLRHLYGRASNSPCLLLCAWFSVNSRPLRVGGGMRHASDAILTILTQLVPASGCFFCATTSLGLRIIEQHDEQRKNSAQFCDQVSNHTCREKSMISKPLRRNCVVGFQKTWMFRDDQTPQENQGTTISTNIPTQLLPNATTFLHPGKRNLGKRAAKRVTGMWILHHH